MRDIPCPRCSAQRGRYCDNINGKTFIHMERIRDRGAMTTELELMVYRRAAAVRAENLRKFRAHLAQLRETP